jgi:hypothetical protein
MYTVQFQYDQKETQPIDATFRYECIKCKNGF